MPKTDPYAPPSKVRDEDAASKLDQLLVAFGQMARMFDGLGEELRATVEAVAQREAPTVDLAPLRGDLAALVERLERQPQTPDLKFPPELEQMLRQQAAGGISKDDWEDLTQRLQEAVRSSQNAPTVVAGRAGGDVRLFDTDRNVVNPATEPTLAAIQTAVEGPLPAGSNTIGTVLTSSAMSPLNAAGQVFVGGRRVNVAALSGARSVVALRNPATSGVKVNMFALVIYSSVSQWFRYAEDPTLSSPTNHGNTAKSLNRANVGTSPVEMLTDTAAPTVADFWDAETRLTANAPVGLSFPVPVIIPPGKTFAVVGDASAEHSAGINGYYFHTPA